MDLLSSLKGIDYENMASHIEAISQKDENEIYKTIGKTLHFDGYTTLSSNSLEMIHPDAIYQRREGSQLNGFTILNSYALEMNQPDATSHNLSCLDSMNLEINKGPNMISPKLSNMKKYGSHRDMPKTDGIKAEGLNIETLNQFINNTSTLTEKEAKQEGESFWKLVKVKLQHEICSNKEIEKLMSGEGKLKDYLLIGIPIVIAAIGIPAISPIALPIVVSVFALIIKVGFEAYCSMNLNKEVVIIKDVNKEY